MTLIDQNKEHFQKAIEHLKSEIAGLRTGRATPALVEDIAVEAYGTKQPLKALASITVSDAKTLTVEPWDKSILAAVEAAIRQSDVGINPVNDGKLIRLPLPELTTERRQELIKLLHQKLEAARVAVRQVREDIRRVVEKKEKAKEIGEDEKFKLHKQLDDVVKEYNEKIKKIGEDKEKEIVTV
ncbi:MAG: ribosome recycling factor [Candidatus Magasanikbacteria bacterium RIFCSPHIGHO2_02_FULL_51_14]|uniref:Ribosome-recycling factor n=1 Tax=Candidatus Magasanikbacteria bacterium RIFCSPHIGHO2_02_FULL_51_14 TaxID=1798683 RepID=A0A1F6MDI2_9BACT|nr:MAG: ribosome recycling factor [Candidatus Magasanikbacteria bacterium RIFCSPHIGHO2_02_FULL_51_14]